MNLSAFLQSPEILSFIRDKNHIDVKNLILEKGLLWYVKHPKERERIKINLSLFGLLVDDATIDKVIHNIILHYVEKILPLTNDPIYLMNFITTSIDMYDAVKVLKETSMQGKGILIAVSHFGGLETIIPSLAKEKFAINAVLKFTTEKFSQVAHTYAEKMANSGEFSLVNFIEIGKPGSISALDMAGALRKKEILLTVFDEDTPHSKPVNLLGKQLRGGAGLDKLLAFTKAPVAVFNAFMIRTDSMNYHLKLIEVDPTAGELTQQMYRNFESVLKDHFEQWYFLHEEIPFVS